MFHFLLLFYLCCVAALVIAAPMGGGCSLFVGGQHNVTGDALPPIAEKSHHRTPFVGIEGHPAHQNVTQKQRLVFSMQATTSRLSGSMPSCWLLCVLAPLWRGG